MPDHHLAQLNLGLLRAPLDSPQLADFVAQLDPINALADAAPGFVWRLTAEGSNDATQIRPYDDDMIAINLSVWTSFETLWNFVYRTAHLDVMRRRRQFFHRMLEPYLALWWIPAGELPTVEQAVERLAYLRAHGPSPYAFTFKQPYPDPTARPHPEPAVAPALSGTGSRGSGSRLGDGEAADLARGAADR